MKTCYKCKISKEEIEFSKNKFRSDGLQTMCKLCANKKHKKYYKDNRQKQIKQISEAKKIRIQENCKRLYLYLKQHACLNCGNNDPRVLQFDHTRDKVLEVTLLLQRGSGWNTVEKEIQKCQILCANCHTLKTQKERNTYRYKFYEMGL